MIGPEIFSAIWNALTYQYWDLAVPLAIIIVFLYALHAEEGVITVGITMAILLLSLLGWVSVVLFGMAVLIESIAKLKRWLQRIDFFGIELFNWDKLVKCAKKTFKNNDDRGSYL